MPITLFPQKPEPPSFGKLLIALTILLVALITPSCGESAKAPVTEDVAVAPTDAIYIADTQANQIHRLEPDGRRRASWGSPGSGPGQFSTPEGITVDNDGNILVADSGNHRIQKFDSQGCSGRF